MNVKRGGAGREGEVCRQIRASSKSSTRQHTSAYVSIRQHTSACRALSQAGPEESRGREGARELQAHAENQISRARHCLSERGSAYLRLYLSEALLT
jgi:hypothetical protein